MSSTQTSRSQIWSTPPKAPCNLIAKLQKGTYSGRQVVCLHELALVIFFRDIFFAQIISGEKSAHTSADARAVAAKYLPKHPQNQRYELHVHRQAMSDTGMKYNIVFNVVLRVRMHFTFFLYQQICVSICVVLHTAIAQYVQVDYSERVKSLFYPIFLHNIMW